MEGANEAEMVTRVVLDGAVYMVSLAGKAAGQLLTFLAAAAASGIKKAATADKISGQAKLASLLRSGKELKLFTFTEEQFDEFKKEAKRFGIVFSAVRRSEKDIADGTYDVLCKAEDAVRLQRILERMGVTEVEVSASGSRATPEQAASKEIKDVEILAQELANIREMMGQMFSPDGREQNPVQAADVSEHQSAAYSGSMEADAAPEARHSVMGSMEDIRENIGSYQPEEAENRNPLAELLANMLQQSPEQDRGKSMDRENAAGTGKGGRDEEGREPTGNKRHENGNAAGAVKEAAGSFGSARESGRELVEEFAKEYEQLMSGLNRGGMDMWKE